MKKWKTKKSNLIHSNNWFDVYHDEYIRHDNKNGEYFVIKKHPAVFIIPEENDKIYLIKQYRYPIEKWTWELPAGSSDGQDLLYAAKRELKEETGFKSDNWELVDVFHLSPGLSNNTTHLFVARNLIQTNHNTQKEEGIINMEKFTKDQIKTMIKENEIVGAPTIAALTLYWL